MLYVESIREKPLEAAKGFIRYRGTSVRTKAWFQFDAGVRKACVTSPRLFDYSWM